MLTEEMKVLIEETLHILPNIIRYNVCVDENIQGLGYDDLYQTACIALCHAATQYDVTKGASFKTYAEVVVKDKLHKHVKKIVNSQSRLSYLDELLHENGFTLMDTLSGKEDPALVLETDELFRILEHSYHKHSGINQKGIHAIMLRGMGKTNADIARAYHVPANHVRSWISRAASILRKDPALISYLQ